MMRAVWFARHEMRLAWREIVAMITAGRPGRLWIAGAFIAGFVVVLHLAAWKTMTPFGVVTFPPDRDTLIVVTGTAFLAWTVMISQAMEAVTRAFYARGDLELLLSSPAPTRGIFALRVIGTGVTTSALSLILLGPFINMLALAGGARWLAAYGVLAAMAATATAFAVATVVLLFRLVGPKRTRLIAQIVAAVVGAAFVIGVQAVSILTYGKLSRFDAFQSSVVTSLAPEPGSVFWLPARAAMGDLAALAAVFAASFFLLALAVSVASRRFGHFALAAASVGQSGARQARRRSFRSVSAGAALRRKEWTLLLRDPWLASQTLMQVFYLIPPALMLWRNYGQGPGGLIVLAPVLVMAAGQLAGGLAWLAISGEDAPELVATAPVRWRSVLRAKIEAVLGAVSLLLAPVLLALATASFRTASIAAAGVLVAASASTAIQMLFRSQAKRSQMRRRQTSSRIATFAEAFSSIGWAATAGFAAAGNVFAAATAAMALAVIALAALFRPGRAVAARA